MQKACIHCQSNNSLDAPTCQNCGRPFEIRETETAESQETMRWTGTSQELKTGLRRTTSLEQLFAGKSMIVIGRTPECDLVLAHPVVSRRHAVLERSAAGELRITDLGSLNGLTIGGQRLAGSAVLRQSDQVGIGPFLVALIGDNLCTIDNSRGLRLEARALEKIVALPNGTMRKLLDNINLAIEPGEFVSVLGPSGSGKSTLMDCLNGRRRATGGLVLANGVDFYRHFDSFRQSLGYVPQKDIVHNQLTVARALYYTAQLRLPRDTSGNELAGRMEEVIRLMELGQHRDTLIADLSGGQIKRVSLGAELLARPSMLYIDEATSGLDAGTEARMMKLFRNLADEGKSLICITHNIDNVDRCHLIIVLARGKLVYYGPPAEARTYFGVGRISEIYDRLQDHDIESWEKQYAASSLHDEFVARRLGPGSAGRTPAPDATRPGSAWNFDPNQSSAPLHEDPPLRLQFAARWHQFLVLARRYVELIWNDRRSLKLTLLQAPLIALFVLAGFIGKPFQQKIPVPHISDEEFLGLQMIQALGHDLKSAPAPDAKNAAFDKFNLRMRLANADEPALTIPHRELARRLKELADRPNGKQLLERTEITIEQPGAEGPPRRVTRTAAQLLDLHKALEGSSIMHQLMEAHAIAGTTNPRYTYILLFLLSIIVLWSGCNNAAKEIVKEEAIYGRERAVNLTVSPYLASKFLVMGLFTIAQTLILMVMVYGTLHLVHAADFSFIEHNDLPATEYMLPYVEQFGVLSLLAMAGVALGLLVSACVNSPDRANSLLPYVLIPQIILGGGIMPIRVGALKWLAWLVSPEYWAFRAIRLGETDLPAMMADNRMEYEDVGWLPCAILLMEILAMLAATAWFLRKKDAS